MDGLVNLALALVFFAHVVAFSALGARARRRGRPAARYALLIVAFSLLTSAELAQLATLRGWLDVPEQGVRVVTWVARMLFAVGLGMLLFRLRRATRRRSGA